MCFSNRIFIEQTEMQKLGLFLSVSLPYWRTGQSWSKIKMVCSKKIISTSKDLFSDKPFNTNVKLCANKLFKFLPSGSNPRTVSDRKDFSRCGNAELSSAFLLSLLDPEVTIAVSLPATFCTFKSDETSWVPEVWPPSSLWLGWFDESKEQVRGWTGGGGPLCVGGMPDPILGLGGRVGGLGLLWGSIKIESAGLLSPSSELLKY